MRRPAFRDNKYTMTGNGNVMETGTYSVQVGKLAVKTEEGMNMDANVIKEKRIFLPVQVKQLLIPIAYPDLE